MWRCRESNSESRLSVVSNAEFHGTLRLSKVPSSPSTLRTSTTQAYRLGQCNLFGCLALPILAAFSVSSSTVHNMLSARPFGRVQRTVAHP